MTRRERILAAAIKVFAQAGFHAASTRAIAKAAGVTDPLLFYHFKSKADLYLAAVQDQIAKLREGLDQALTGVDNPRDQLRLFVEVYLRYFLDLEPGLTVTLRELYGVPPHVADAISETHAAATTARLGRILLAGVERGVFRPMNIPACTTAIGGILHIFIRGEARRPGRFSRTEMVEQVLDYYVNGLRPDETSADRGRAPLTAVPIGDD
jgi:TetR/AcrR family fatty acid metabolism transcriptional regulator